MSQISQITGQFVAFVAGGDHESVTLVIAAELPLPLTFWLLHRSQCRPGEIMAAAAATVAIAASSREAPRWQPWLGQRAIAVTASFIRDRPDPQLLAAGQRDVGQLNCTFIAATEAVHQIASCSSDGPCFLGAWTAVRGPGSCR